MRRNSAVSVFSSAATKRLTRASSRRLGIRQPVRVLGESRAEAADLLLDREDAVDHRGGARLGLRFGVGVRRLAPCREQEHGQEAVTERMWFILIRLRDADRPAAATAATDRALHDVLVASVAGPTLPPLGHRSDPRLRGRRSA
jgi:hypothetical protein